MSKILLNISEFVMSFSVCTVVSVEVLKESINYLVLSILILLIRWLSAKVEKKIEQLKNKKKNDFKY